MKKRVVFMLLAAALMLSACGSSQEQAPAAPEESEVSEDTEPAAEEELKEDTEQEPEEVPEAEEMQESSDPNAESAYVAENELSYTETSSFSTKGVRYNPDHQEDFDVIDVSVNIQEVEITDAEDEGYLNVFIKYVASGKTWSLDEEHNKTYISVPCFSVCDSYTGRIVPGGSLEGDNELEYYTELEWDGMVYDIGYTRTSQWQNEEYWDLEPDGSSTLRNYNYGTYTIRIPKEYNGLALLMTPNTEVKDIEDGVVNEEEKYIMDEWEEGCVLLSVEKLNEFFNGSL